MSGWRPIKDAQGDAFPPCLKRLLKGSTTSKMPEAAKATKQLVYRTTNKLDNVLGMLKALHESYNAGYELLNLYERQKNRFEKALSLKAATSAQKQTRTSRQALSASQELAIDLQVEVNGLTEQLANQPDVNVLTEKDHQRRQDSILHPLFCSDFEGLSCANQCHREL